MLTDAKAKAAKPRDKAYKLADAEQLYLHVSTSGSRLWRMDYKHGGKRKTLSFGAYPTVTLSDARRKRDEAKALIRDGFDPAVERRLTAKAQEADHEATFERIARRWWERNKPRWSARHSDDVIQSLERDVFPEIGGLPIARLRAPRILDLLHQIERRGSVETAKRIRQRISGVFGSAIAMGIADSDPTASLKNELQPVTRRSKQPAITDLDGVRRVLTDAEATPSHIITKLALRMLALTAVRPGELRGARWEEIDGVDWTRQLYGPYLATWTVPAARMKGTLARKEETGGDHVVPLSMEAIDVLLAMRDITGRLPMIFPNQRSSHQPMSENAIGYLLNRAGYHGRHVPHGWRAAFSTIMNERASREGRAGDRAVVDLMLAHVPKDKVESAYNRAAFMPRRRAIAQEWATLLMEGKPNSAALVDRPYRDPVVGEWSATRREFMDWVIGRALPLLPDHPAEAVEAFLADTEKYQCGRQTLFGPGRQAALRDALRGALAAGRTDDVERIIRTAPDLAVDPAAA
jgi:integrase